MRRASTLLLVSAMAFIGGCVALGWRFGPGFSCTSGAMFAAPPVVEQRGQEYLLTWKQGSFEFFYQPDYKVMGDRLIFVLQGTSSSGSLAGRRREMKIEGVENLKALKSGGAYWWEREPEPNGSFVALKIVTPSSEERGASH